MFVQQLVWSNDKEPPKVTITDLVRIIDPGGFHDSGYHALMKISRYNYDMTHRYVYLFRIVCRSAENSGGALVNANSIGPVPAWFWRIATLPQIAAMHR